ncbi:MAG: CRISPR system precrRNA processing endoribonuclease RAMP protein Cas6 [Rhodoferax sp.]|nr:CRISPR system precrRNA processing endoribonuclease RAMP protein Cas6 [Rhodoferax sp.]
MLAVEAALGPGRAELPLHLGGILHGFVERAILNHAPYLIQVLRPTGDDDYASMAIEPPHFGPLTDPKLRFGLILFRDATQSWSVITRALLAQACMGLNQRHLEIQRSWIYQPGSPVQAIVMDGQLIDDTPWPESPSAWIRRAPHPKTAPGHHLQVHQLEFRSPLLLGARGNIRRTQQVPWPSLKSLLDAIAKRMLVLEPELGQAIGLAQGWRARDALAEIQALTSAAAPALQVQWPYAAHRSIYKPGIVGSLTYVAALDASETALLHWGQWLGVGQQTTLGCGRYVWSPQNS